MSTEPEPAAPSKHWMTVEDVAYILHRTRWAVWKALIRGAIPGEKVGRQWRIPSIEVLRIIYADDGKRCQRWACEVFPKNFKIVDKSTGHFGDLNRCNTEAAMLRDAAAADPGEQIEPREAALRFQHEFKFMAKELARRDPYLQDDLVQEMSLAVLEETEKATESFFLWLACWRAKDFLKRERLRGGICPSKLGQLAIEAQQISDETLVQALLDEGHALKAIEEALGIKLVFDDQQRSA